MAIRVQHGVPEAPGLSGLARNAASLLAAATRGRGGQTQGGRGGQGFGTTRGLGPDAREIEELRAYNDRIAAEQDADIASQQAREEAKLEARQFDYKFTQRQRQEQAQRNNAIQALNSSEEFSEEEKAIGRRSIEKKYFGIDEPTALPSDPDKVKFPEGQGAGATWENAYGGVSFRDKDGQERTLLKPVETDKGIRNKQEYEQLDKLNKFIMEKAAENIGDTLSGPKFRSKKQIIELRDNIVASMGAVEEEVDPAAAEAIFQQGFDRLLGDQPQPQSQQQDPIAEAQARGINVTDVDMDLPPEVAVAQATVRDISVAYKGKTMPDEVRQEYAAAYDLWNEYVEGPNAQKISRQGGPAKNGLKKKKKTSNFARAFGNVTVGF